MRSISRRALRRQIEVPDWAEHAPGVSTAIPGGVPIPFDGERWEADGYVENAYGGQDSVMTSRREHRRKRRTYGALCPGIVRPIAL